MIRIIALLILIIGLGAGLYLVQHPQILNPKAYNEPAYDSNVKPEYKLEKGFQIDTFKDFKIPPTELYNVLNPQWVRFVYRIDKGIPSNIPSNVKILLIFNAQSAEIPEETKDRHEPKGSQDVDEWKRYIDQYYIPGLKDFLSKRLRFDVVQVWNEEDNCPPKDPFSCTLVPPQAYTYMLTQVVNEVKSYTNNKKIITGGLVTGSPDYISQMKQAHPGILKLIDGIAIHPYGVSPDGWCKQDPPSAECQNIVLPFGGGDLATAVQNYVQVADGLPIYITEVGTASAEDGAAQGEYLRRVFNILSNIKVSVVIWYGWSDLLLARDEEDKGSGLFGLVNKNNVIKPSGVEFKLFNAN